MFKIHNGNDGPERVYGIRDYFNELVYWAFPSNINNPVYPTRVLVYNYRNNTWSFFKDSFTCFGSFQKSSDLTWETVEQIYPTWSVWNDPWGSPLFQSGFPDIAAGNQEGFVFIIDAGLSSNSQSLSITDMVAANDQLTVVDHNLTITDYVLVEQAQGITSLNDSIFRVQKVINKNTIVLDTTFTGTYTGGGKLARVSNLRIISKQFNPGTPIGKQFRIPYLDFLLNRTQNGEVSLNYFIETTFAGSTQTQSDPEVLLGSNILYTRAEDNKTFQPIQQQIWHRYFVQTQAQFLQLLFFMSDAQMKNKEISQSDFELHGWIFYASQEGRIIG